MPAEMSGFLYKTRGRGFKEPGVRPLLALCGSVAKDILCDAYVFTPSRERIHSQDRALKLFLIPFVHRYEPNSFFW